MLTFRPSQYLSLLLMPQGLLNSVETASQACIQFLRLCKHERHPNASKKQTSTYSKNNK